MKFKYVVGIMVLCIFTVMQAQTTQIQVELNPIPNSSSDWQLELTMELSSSPPSGLVIDLPKEVEIVPRSIRINDRDIWVQNIESVPQMDSVMAWYSIPEGVMLLYNKGLLETGDNFVIDLMASISKKPLDGNELHLKEIVLQTNGYVATEQIFASGLIPPIPNR